ncbi:uncharacterized protein [Chelonus insularis]|uniref:uncharacterized protein n=1 Tax=Chelonus insularis TaxID=460826 RepID=UPI001588C9D7|nr:uncharacterized protein LOC118069946 [Chelonus insularis]
MISIFINLLICLNICTCLIPTVFFDLNKSTITKFPWMVAITNESSLVGYGTLIHKKAVLTRAILEPEPKNIESIRVHADCFFLGEEAFETNYNCSKVRQVSEYNIIEEHQNDYKKNLAILILINSFQLTEDVNIIQLTKSENDIYSGNCAIVSLKTVKNRNSDARFARFFSLLCVTMNNRTSIEPMIPLQSFEGTEIYDSEIKSFEVETFWRCD